MKISLNWIKDFVDLDGISVKELWNRYTMATAEVDDIIEKGKDINNVVIAKVVKVEPHPSSEKLKVVQVDVGEEIAQSVCGAPNIREDIFVPFAKIGGSIKNIPLVSKTVINGVESDGVICSPSELGISDNHDGVMVLPGEYVSGTDIKKIIDIDDIVVDIDNKSLTNRPDLWGHYGIARELAAIFRRKLKPIEISQLDRYNNLRSIDINIENIDKCFRYSGLVIERIKPMVTPLKIQVRLYYCGMRTVSPIVDLTNYIMLELGQPMHAYDRRSVEKIVVSATEKPEKIVTLDGNERTIPQGVLMIYNQDRRPLALAGIMGGQDSEVSDTTTSIVLESANFEGSSIRKSSSILGLRTEASARFEKMLDPNLTVLSVKRFVKLLQDMQGDVEIVSNLTDVYPKRLEPVMITIEKAFIDKYIGNVIDSKSIIEILESLEFDVKNMGDTFMIGVPSFRSTKDITMKVDIVEEITRIYGYDNIIPKTLDVTLEPLRYNEELLTDHRIKEVLAEKFGFSEVNSYVWYDNTVNESLGIKCESKVKIQNPHSSDSDTLRDSLVPIMLGFALKNVKYTDKINIFEIGSVFSLADVKKKCEQQKNLCILRSDKKLDENGLFYELKGIASYLLRLIKKVEPDFTAFENRNISWVYPVKAVSINYNGENLGYISVVHPQIRKNIDKKLNIAILELNLSAVYKIEEKSIKYNEPLKYPEVNLDFSFLVDKDVLFKRVNKCISEYSNSVLIGYKFLYEYSGKELAENKKSLTFRFRIGSDKKTLSNEEIEYFKRDLLDYMERNGYSLRQ